MSLFSRDGMLTGTEIERRVKKGHIQISPYDPKCVNPNSYNLKLHPQLLIYKRDAERANIIPQNIAEFRETPIGGNFKYIEYCDSPFATLNEINYKNEPSYTEEAKDELPSIDQSHDDMNSGNRSYFNNGFITGHSIRTLIDDKVGAVTESVAEKINNMDVKYTDIFDQLSDRVANNEQKSRERDEEIKSLPIVESNYLPPLDMHKKNETIEFQIPEEGYVLQPGVLYIGRTVERTATDRFIPMINGRSSGGRLGISIHICAGFGDIGFDGTWTLEITVVEPVRIYPNEEIAQVCFFTPAGKKAKLYRGRYYRQEDATASRFYQPKKEY